MADGNVHGNYHFATLATYIAYLGAMFRQLPKKAVLADCFFSCTFIIFICLVFDIYDS